MKISGVFRDIRDSAKRFIVLYGGAGSGKSVYMVQHILLDVVSNPNVKWCIIRKVARTIKESVFAELSSQISDAGLTHKFNINKSDYSITCDNGSRIIMLGIDDPEKIKSISGIHKFWIEEASELDFADFKQINLRLRGRSLYIKQIYLTFNPIHNQHWLKVYFFDDPKPNALILKTTYHDNPFLDDEYKMELENLRELDEYWYNVYCLGEWGNISGVVYTNWSVLEDWPEFFTETIYGLDFGYNVPTALVEVSTKDGEYYIKEKIYECKLTNSDLIARLKELGITNSIYADSAEPDRIQELRNAGFIVYEADKSVKDGIDYVKSQKLYIHQDSTNIKNEMNTYAWKKDHVGNATDIPIKINDHACFIGETLVTTDIGPVPIKYIKPGDMVLTRDGYRPVISSGSTGVREVREYNINSISITGTPDHPVITPNGKVDIANLKVHDWIYTNKLVPINSISYSYSMYRVVYNIEVMDKHEYYANGLLVSNCDGLRYALYTHNKSTISMPRISNSKVEYSNNHQTNNNAISDLKTRFRFANLRNRI